MNFKYYYMSLVIEAINRAIIKKKTLINVKRIRQFYNIPGSDKSVINFIWRSLDYLEKRGFIIEHSNNGPSKRYYVPKEILDISKVLIK